NQAVRSFDVNSGRPLLSLPNPKWDGRPMALAPEGQSFVWMPRDGNPKLIDPISLQERGELKGITFGHLLVWAADGKTLTAWSRHGKNPTELPIHDATTGQVRRTIPVGDLALSAVALSPDGQNLAVLSHGNNTGTLKMWNTANGEEVLNRNLTGFPF